ncbi:hypothetical protein RV10_GL000880 [Enterococcus pallens]|nr:hypothetical protein RV10_GL000880 [Enterococcus pallens]
MARKDHLLALYSANSFVTLTNVELFQRSKTLFVIIIENKLENQE